MADHAIGGLKKPRIYTTIRQLSPGYPDYPNRDWHYSSEKWHWMTRDFATMIKLLISLGLL